MKISLGAFALAIAMSTGVAPAVAKEVNLRAGVFFASKQNVMRQAFDEFVEAVNADGEGLVKIGQVVSNESVPVREMPAALQGGLLDIIATPPSYFSSYVPGSEGLSAARLDPGLQRENGALDALNAALGEKANARILAQYGTDMQFHIFTNFKVETLEDFKGRRMGVSNTWKAFFDALGIQTIQTPVSEYYTSIERGVIEGYANVNNTLPPFGLDELTKYRIDPGFYRSVVVVAINKNKWDSLNDEQKAYLNEKALQLETEISSKLKAKDDAIGQKMIDDGAIEVLTLSDADAQVFGKMSTEASWEVTRKRAPEFGAKLQNLLDRDQ